MVRHYEIAAVQKKLVYNRYGDHDPDGLIFVPVEELDLVLAGKYKPKPLILRANVGDWLEVVLHNALEPDRPVPYYDYPRVPLDMKHKPSSRVSLNPQFLQYDPVSDSGINVGYNAKEQAAISFRRRQREKMNQWIRRIREERARITGLESLSW